MKSGKCLRQIWICETLVQHARKHWYQKVNYPYFFSILLFDIHTCIYNTDDLNSEDVAFLAYTNIYMMVNLATLICILIIFRPHGNQLFSIYYKWTGCTLISALVIGVLLPLGVRSAWRNQIFMAPSRWTQGAKFSFHPNSPMPMLYGWEGEMGSKFLNDYKRWDLGWNFIFCQQMVYAFSKFKYNCSKPKLNLVDC